MKLSQRTITRIAIWVLIIFAGAGIYRISGHPVVRCYLVAFSNLDEIASGVFVDAEMPDTDRESLLAAIAEAEERISHLFGEYQATPTIIAGQSMDVMKEYGGNSYNRVGRTYLTLLGSYIVLGPDGITDIDVIAHEMVHAELESRIGHSKVNHLPGWFEEGVAVQFDERFSEEDWQLRTSNGKYAPDVRKIGTIKHDDWLAYATAKHEVRHWLEEIGQDGFRLFLQSIRDGENFDQAYQLARK
jgi:hypothetical protein